MNVLIIRSSENDCIELEDIIEKSGFDVHVLTTLNSLDSKQLLQDTRIICLDVCDDANKQNELCMKIRNLNHLQMLPIVVLYDNESTDDDLKKNFLKCGATEIISRNNLEAIKNSFFEYAHRFKHDQLSGRVLVVEDEELLSELIQLILKIVVYRSINA